MTEQLALPFLNNSTSLTAVELCAGAGGQALGLHSVGFQPLALVDNDRNCIETLRENFKGANFYLEDVRTWNAQSEVVKNTVVQILVQQEQRLHGNL